MPGIDKLVTITLDKERRLKLGLKGMIAFESETGLSWRKGFKLQDLELKEIAAMLWSCLLHEDTELTFDGVLDLVDFDNISSVMDALAECLNQSLPEIEAGSRPLVKKPQSG